MSTEEEERQTAHEELGIFKHLDRNKDGKIDLDDVAHEWNKLDKNEDGKVDLTDIIPGMVPAAVAAPAASAKIVAPAMAKADEERAAWAAIAEAGERADFVLVYNTRAHEKDAKKREELDEAIVKLEHAGLRAVKVASPTGLRTFVLITAQSRERYEEEAERRQFAMLLARQPDDPDGARPKAILFKRVLQDKFARKDGALFSPLERQRLAVTIIQGSSFRGGAELDLDELVEKKVLRAAFQLHTDERDALASAWMGVRTSCGQWPHGWPYAKQYKACSGKWPLRRDDNREKRRVLPDLAIAQQPLDAIRSYFGSKIAFYFAWAETYTLWLFVSMWFGIIMYVVGLYTPGAAALSKMIYCIGLSCGIAYFYSYWEYRAAGLAYTWQVADYKSTEPPRPEFHRAYRRGFWAGKENGGKGRMKLDNGYYSRMGRFIEDEVAPKAYNVDQCARRGVFATGVVLLLGLTQMMVVGTLSILVFRMLMQRSSQLANSGVFNAANASIIGSVLNAIWVGLMNVAYGHLATMFNDLENHRTDSDHEDALILKTFLFQFCNSYGALFYIAFVKAQRLPLFDAFGQRDSRGNFITDFCGAVGTEPYQNVDPACGTGGGCKYVFVERDCMGELGTQIISYLVVTPFMNLVKTLMMPYFNKYITKWKMRRAKAAAAKRARAESTTEEEEEEEEAGEDEDEAAKADSALASGSKSAALAAGVAKDLLLPRFASTFGEYNSKMIQFGFIAMFSAALPVVSIAAAFTNLFELRADGYKLLYLLRRPQYKGAEGIGKWKLVVEAISWLALIVNALILVFTSNQLRDSIVIPSIATLTDAQCEAADGIAQSVDSLADEAKYFGLPFSWKSDCPRNFHNCYAQIGGEAWLPGISYLTMDDTGTLPYHKDGLCAPSSPLYNAEHCITCLERRDRVSYALILAFLAIEHVLIFFKLAIRLAFPSQPAWVDTEVAREEFRLEQLEKESAVQSV